MKKIILTTILTITIIITGIAATLYVNNPVTDNFIINYRVNTDGYAKMILYDIKGKKIKNLMSKYIKKGSFSIKKNA